MLFCTVRPVISVLARPPSAWMASMSACMPAPPEGSWPAMTRTFGFIRMAPQKSERLDHGEADDDQQHQRRRLVEPAVEHMAFGVFVAGEFFHVGQAHVVVTDQQEHQRQLG